MLFFKFPKVLLIVGLLGMGSWWLVNRPKGIKITIHQPTVTVQQLFQFSDPSSLLTFPEIVVLPRKEWQEVPAVNFGNRGGTGWAYVRVHSPGTQSIFMEMQTHFIDSVNVWLLDETGAIQALPATGFSSLSSADYNPLQHRYFLAELPMEKDRAYKVFIRGSTAVGFPIKYFLKFWDQPGFINYTTASNRGWALFVGMVLTALFLSLAGYIIHRKLIYFYFGTYILCFSLYALLNDGWGVHLNASINNFVNPIRIGHLLNLGICFFLLFSRKFLVIPKQSPKWWLKISPWWFYIAIALCIILTNFAYANAYTTLPQIGYWLGISIVISVLVLWLGYLADAVQREFQPAWLLLASQFFLILFFSTNIFLVNLNSAFLPFPDMLLLRIALTVQLFIIAIGWIYRQKVINESREQLTLLNIFQQKAVWGAEHRWQELQIETLRMENELHGQRDRLARDLHDGIGSQLTHIISRLDLLSFTPTPQQNQLFRLRDFTRETNQNLRETIWVLNQKEITFSEFSLRLQSLLSNIWDEQHYPLLTWDCTTLADKRLLSPLLATHLFRISQEAIANVIKHAGATEVNVCLEYIFPEIVLTIRDNGHGFNQAMATSGFGLGYMRKRAEEMNGYMELTSGSSGTEIRIRIPVTP